MKTVWKSKLPIVAVQELKVPPGAQFMHVDTQFGEPHVWYLAEVPDDGTKPPILEARHLYVVGTGNPVPEPGKKPLEYIGTLKMNDGQFMWHVFVQ